jgi:hypothetical protein
MVPARVHVHRDSAHGTTRRHEARMYCMKSRDRAGQAKKDDGEVGARRNKNAERPWHAADSEVYDVASKKR